ncbi:hypothetical protein [Paenibacillus radicis (ex Gao et al. 2016)]|uniref:hypothetical protein n=1 Tax=Paenibacillus radicis (ex Gao et al. 2016) TaxID=1737354 RepID=UPI00166D10BA|nr:hypothetical protein [Paenibacillus radicis (ex Gao et al. 2016)]
MRRTNQIRFITNLPSLIQPLQYLPAIGAKLSSLFVNLASPIAKIASLSACSYL